MTEPVDEAAAGAERKEAAFCLQGDTKMGVMPTRLTHGLVSSTLSLHA